jgi:F1F0 ATPase subunit 2
MEEYVMLLLSLLFGGILGLVFFGGLWFTINKAVASKHPEIWFFISMLLRVFIVVVGFYFVSAGHFERLLICLAGFIISRMIITRKFDVNKKLIPAPESVFHD